jgi:preprotein translocase subunit YajC
MAELLFLTVLMLLGMGAYWAMVLFPRQRDFQKRQQMARALSAGDEIITFGGIIGKVQAIDAEQGIAHVEIAKGVTVRLVTAALVQRYDPEEIAENARKGLDTENTPTNTTS